MIKTTILYYLAILMMAFLFFSRTGLAFAMLAFVLVAFIDPAPKQLFKKFFSTPLLWGMSLLFIVPLVSGLWSQDKDQWLTMMQTKLPLLFLPLAFASSFSFSPARWQALAVIFILLLIGGTLYSLLHYLPDIPAIDESYLRAGSLATPLENDHVRFSWLVFLAIVFCGWLYYIYRGNRPFQFLLVLIAIWFIIYLHLLAARTGLISFYLGLFILAIYILLKKSKKIYAITILIVLLALPVLAYFLLPSFHNRVDFFNYERPYFLHGGYIPGSNDAVRMISMKAGWSVMMNEPLSGAGFGDILTETKSWYAIHYPEMKNADMIYPSSEWLMYGSGAGVAGFFLFSLAMLCPFFTRVRLKLPWWMINITAAFSLAADIGLEVQYGVFIYSFFVLLCNRYASLFHSDRLQE
jgi:O-antigen ligase